MRLPLLPFFLGAVAALPVHAGEVYGAAGLPGAMLGYSQPVADGFALRADVSTVGDVRFDERDSGMNYQAKGKLNRAGVYADWFAFDSGFRLTGGATFNDARVRMSGWGNGDLVTVGDNAYLLTPADRIDARGSFARVTPYLGIGWGHRATDEAGWGVAFDLGASIGSYKVTGDANGPVLSTPMAQRDFQRELQDQRDDLNRYRVLPQLSLAVGYRF